MPELECMLEMPVFAEIKPVEKYKLLQVINSTNYSPGEIIFNQGEDMNKVYFVKRGKITLKTIFPSGEEIALGIVGPNEIMGAKSFSANKKHISTARALEDSFLCTCDMLELKNFMRENPRIAIKIIENIGEKLEDRELKVSELAAFDVRRRLIALLQRMAEKFGVEKEKGIEIDLNLTHQEIADFIGASRVMVSNILQEINGVTAYRGKVIIEDLSLLEDGERKQREYTGI